MDTIDIREVGTYDKDAMQIAHELYEAEVRANFLEAEEGLDVIAELMQMPKEQIIDFDPVYKYKKTLEFMRRLEQGANKAEFVFGETKAEFDYAVDENITLYERYGPYFQDALKKAGKKKRFTSQGAFKELKELMETASPSVRQKFSDYATLLSYEAVTTSEQRLSNAKEAKDVADLKLMLYNRNAQAFYMHNLRDLKVMYDEEGNKVGSSRAERKILEYHNNPTKRAEIIRRLVKRSKAIHTLKTPLRVITNTITGIRSRFGDGNSSGPPKEKDL